MSKLIQLQDLMRDGDMIGALRMAAGFPRLGECRDRVQRGWSAHQNPEMYRGMGHDPDSLVADGIESVRERFGSGA